LSFIPLIIRSKNLFSSESSLKYFLIQALASAVFLFTIIINLFLINFTPNLLKLTIILISSTIIIKTGAAPFHFWLPSVIEGLTWNSNIILITWQKIAPLIIISYCINIKLIILRIFFCISFGRLGGLNQTSLRKLIAFSSINHLGWIIAGMINREALWVIYFLFYCFLRILIILTFNRHKLFNISQTFSFFTSNKIVKFILFINLFSIGGLPPFLGFFPKWLIIESLISMNRFRLLTFILFLTLITLFFYIRISYSAFLINHKERNWNFKTEILIKNSYLLIFLSFFSLLGLIFINLFFIIV